MQRMALQKLLVYVTGFVFSCKHQSINQSSEYCSIDVRSDPIWTVVITLCMACGHRFWFIYFRKANVTHDLSGCKFPVCHSLPHVRHINGNYPFNWSYFYSSLFWTACSCFEIAGNVSLSLGLSKNVNELFSVSRFFDLYAVNVNLFIHLQSHTCQSSDWLSIRWFR